MKTLLAVITGVALATFAGPASAYVVQITTSIPLTSAADDAELKQALGSAIDDVLHHAIAFSPTVLTIQDARVVGDRVYILLLIADGDAEETLKQLSGEDAEVTGAPRATTPPEVVF